VVGLPPYYQSFILKDNGYKDQAARSSRQMANHVGVIKDWMLGHRNVARVSAFISKQTRNMLARQLPSFMVVCSKALTKFSLYTISNMSEHVT
jgi:hypothetical protein